MDAAPSPVGVAAASPTPPPEWPEATRWVSPPGDRSIRIPSDPATVWPRPAQGAVALFLAVAIGLITWHVYAAQRWSCRPSILETNALDSSRMNLNEADHAQLLQLPGVGENLARRIETYRAEHGGFRDVNELRRVNGIGPRLLEKLQPLVYVEPTDTVDDEPVETPAPRLVPQVKKEKTPLRPSKKTNSLKQAIDINRATVTELQRLPGIGPKLSQRILDSREKKPFQSVDDLRRVPGIGPKTLERLRPYVSLAGKSS